MKLKNLKEGFITERLNKFVVSAYLDNNFVYSHLTNTGRLKDILIKDKKALFIRINGTKLKYRVVGVYDRGLYSIIDIITQNKVFEETLKKNYIPFLKRCIIIKRNPRALDSIFDYLIKCDNKTGYVETKSAVLRGDHDIAMYPDCPSIRGRRQVRDLIKLSKMNINTWLIFISGIPNARCFKPYLDGDPILANLIGEAYRSGVNIYSFSIYMDKDGWIYLQNPSLPLCREWLNKIK